MYQPIHPQSPLETMPTMYDLPSELVGESGLPDEFHIIQATLLTETCQPVGYLAEEILLASDLNLYYDPRHPQWYKRPDWYMVVGVPRANQLEELRGLRKNKMPENIGVYRYKFLVFNLYRIGV